MRLVTIADVEHRLCLRCPRVMVNFARDIARGRVLIEADGWIPYWVRKEIDEATADRKFTWCVPGYPGKPASKALRGARLRVGVA